MTQGDVQLCSYLCHNNEKETSKKGERLGGLWQQARFHIDYKLFASVWQTSIECSKFWMINGIKNIEMEGPELSAKNKNNGARLRQRGQATEVEEVSSQKTGE